MSNEAVMDLILQSLKDIKKDIGEVKTKQTQQDVIIAELQKSPPRQEFNGQSIEQLLSKLNKGSQQELSKIDENLDYAVGLLVKYGKAVGI